VFVVTLLLGGILSLATCFIFLWEDKPTWGVPLGVGLLLTACSFIAWLLSHRDVDRRDATPATFSDPRHGISLSMDARSLDTDAGRKLFARVVTIAANREALPTPDGLVSADMTPVPGSRAAAVERAGAVNSAAESADQKLMARVRNRDETAVTQQSPTGSAVLPADSLKADQRQRPAEPEE
jgi:hypothetical protein